LNIRNPILRSFNHIHLILRLVSIAGLLTIFSSLHAQGLEDGHAAYQSGDYKKALEILRPLAEQGNSQAQLILGVMYDNGQGVDKDPAESIKWYLKAAEQGIPAIQHDVGVKYFQGTGVEQDYQEAAKCGNLRPMPVSRTLNSIWD
jgi:FOG: TPR repeat, SEL1 subfamily